jgi:hypothetical protein
MDSDSVLHRAFLGLSRGLTLRKRPHHWSELQFCYTAQIPVSQIGRVDTVQDAAPADTELFPWISRSWVSSVVFRGSAAPSLLYELFIYPMASSLPLIIE